MPCDQDGSSRRSGELSSDLLYGVQLYGPLDGGLYKCELNNATEENQVANTLREKMNYIYLAIEENFLCFEVQSDCF